MGVSSGTMVLAIALGTGAIALVLLAVGLRMYIRVFVTRSFALDDVLLLIATAAFFSMISLSIALNSLWDSDTGDSNYVVQTTLKYWLAEECLYMVSTAFIKLSISVFLLRLATRPIHRGIIYVTGGVYTGSAIAFFFYLIFSCHPVKFLWDNTIPGGHCRTMESLYNAALWNGIFCTLSDFIFSFLPIWILWDVQMDRKSKVSVAFILSLGMISTVVTAFRFEFLDGILVTKDTVNSHTVMYELTSMIEPAVGIIATSLSAMRAFLRGIYKKLGVAWGTTRGETEQSSRRRMGFWTLRKPKDSNYTESTVQGSESPWLHDLGPNIDMNQPTKCVVLTRVSTGPFELMEAKDVEKGWGVTRTQRWSITEDVNEELRQHSSATTAASSLELVIQLPDQGQGRAI